MFKHSLLIAPVLLAASHTIASAAIIEISVYANCFEVSDSDSYSGSVPGGASAQCSSRVPNPFAPGLFYLEDQRSFANATAFSAEAQLFGEGRTDVPALHFPSGGFDLLLISQLMLVGGTGNATIIPFNWVPAGDPGAGCALQLNGVSLRCEDPLNVTFNVPFTIRVTMSANQTSPRNIAAGQWSINNGILQNGVPFAGASIVEVPEPSQGLAAAMALAFLALRLRKTRR